MDKGSTQVFELIGLHCTLGGSDKVWAATVYKDGAQWFYFAVHGPRGGRMSGDPKPMAEALARKEYEAKLKEKFGKGYNPIDVESASYGLWAHLTGLVPGLRTIATRLPKAKPADLFDQPDAGAGRASAPAPASTPDAGAGRTSAPAPAPTPAPIGVVAPVRTGPRVVVSHISVLPDEDLKRRMADRNWCLAQKANGLRCILEVLADGTLRSFNRLGQQNASVPAAALALVDLGIQCLIDGEWLPGGNYAMFDLLELNGENIRSRPFSERIDALVALAEGANLIDRAGPTLASNVHVAGREGLFVLQPTTETSCKEKIVAEIKAAGGEGYVMRDVRGANLAGNTRLELKVKFEAEIDTIVYGHKPGKDLGSLLVGLLRADGAVIHATSVRSGLTGPTMQRLMAAAATGVPVQDLPVLTVRYLPARTVGVGLVEPKAWDSNVRTDKRATDCTTLQLIDQFGEERQAAIDAAPRVR